MPIESVMPSSHLILCHPLLLLPPIPPSIKVFTSDESWFGMTYPEDKQVVKDEIAKKIASGYYPEKLWDK